MPHENYSATGNNSVARRMYRAARNSDLCYPTYLPNSWSLHIIRGVLFDSDYRVLRFVCLWLRRHVPDLRANYSSPNTLREAQRDSRLRLHDTGRIGGMDNTFLENSMGPVMSGTRK